MSRIIPLFDFVSKVSLDISRNVGKLGDLNKFDVLFLVCCFPTTERSRKKIQLLS